MPLWTPPTFPQSSYEAFATVTASAVAHTKGTWAELESSAPESFGFWIRISGTATAATNTAMLLDIGLGAALSEAVLVPDINAGASAGLLGRAFFIPMYVPAGVRMAARCQAVIGSDTVSVHVTWMLNPPFPGHVFSKCTAYGVTAASSRGTSATPGDGAWGAWSQLAATTSRDHLAWYALVGQQGDTTLNGLPGYVKLGGGPATEKDLAAYWLFFDETNESMSASFPSLPIYAPLPSGTRLTAALLYYGGTEARDVIAYAFD